MSPAKRSTVNKGDIIAKALSTSSIKEEALKADPKLMDKAFRAIFGAIQDSVAEGDKVQITGFGSWEAVDVAARTARNPSTGGEMEVPATVRIRSRIGTGFAGLVKQRADKR